MAKLRIALSHPLPASSHDHKLGPRMTAGRAVRAQLVHDRDFNEIPDRKSFVNGYATVEETLHAMLPSHSNSYCVIS